MSAAVVQILRAYAEASTLAWRSPVSERRRGAARARRSGRCSRARPGEEVRLDRPGRGGLAVGRDRRQLSVGLGRGRGEPARPLEVGLHRRGWRQSGAGRRVEDGVAIVERLRRADRGARSPARTARPAARRGRRAAAATVGPPDDAVVAEPGASRSASSAASAGRTTHAVQRSSYVVGVRSSRQIEQPAPVGRGVARLEARLAVRSAGRRPAAPSIARQTAGQPVGARPARRSAPRARAPRRTRHPRPVDVLVAGGAPGVQRDRGPSRVPASTASPVDLLLADRFRGLEGVPRGEPFARPAVGEERCRRTRRGPPRGGRRTSWRSRRSRSCRPAGCSGRRTRVALRLSASDTTSGRPTVHGSPMSLASAGRPRFRRPPTRFAQAGSSGHARSVIGIVCPSIGTLRVVSVYALGRSATK